MNAAICLVTASGALTSLLLRRRFSSTQKKLVLHLYDHCPFCIRVELVLGWKNIPYERKLYGYGDIEGPTKIIGKKMLPVLEYHDETGAKKYMGESLDIISFLTKDDEHKYKDFSGRKDLKEWKAKSYKPLERILLRPRFLDIGIYDFETEADKQYAMNKYRKQGFKYEEARSKSAESIVKMEVVLKDLNFLKGRNTINGGSDYDLDDINYLPMLEPTAVKDLKGPPKLAYLDEATERAEVAQYNMR